MVTTANEQAKLKGLELQVMFQDESRFGRINDIKRCWSYKGNRPDVAKQIIREYSYIYGAFSPITGVSDMLNSTLHDIGMYEYFLAGIIYKTSR